MVGLGWVGFDRVRLLFMLPPFSDLLLNDAENRIEVTSKQPSTQKWHMFCDRSSGGGGTCARCVGLGLRAVINIARTLDPFQRKRIDSCCGGAGRQSKHIEKQTHQHDRESRFRWKPFIIILCRIKSFERVCRECASYTAEMLLELFTLKSGLFANFMS